MNKPKHTAHKDKQIVILEREENLPGVLKYALTHNNSKVKGFADGESLWKFLQKTDRTLILADLSEAPIDTDNMPDKFQIDILKINRKKRTVKVDGEKISLTPTEFEILSYLSDHKETVISNSELLSHLWGWGEGASNTVVMHIRNLRHKLGPAADMLQTVRGFGYVLTTNSDK